MYSNGVIYFHIEMAEGTEFNCTDAVSFLGLHMNPAACDLFIFLYMLDTFHST